MADMRKCIGSAKFGIEAHEAPPEDFPAQPSQKDGLGRMCKPHWTEYTRALHRDALARKMAEPEFKAIAARKMAERQGSRLGARSDRMAARDTIVAERKAIAKRVRSKPEPIRTRPARGHKRSALMVGDQLVGIADAAIAGEGN